MHVITQYALACLLAQALPLTRTATQPFPRFPRSWFGLVASLAIIALVVGVLAVWSRSRRSTTERRAVEQEEQLLYSHIPGTPKRGKAPGAASVTANSSAAWQPGKGSSPAGKVAGAPVPKKLSNLPA